METRLTLRPGQPGTRKLLARYGERLLRVRYRYDPKNQRRLKTVELIVESVSWRPAPRRPRRRDDEIVAVPIAYAEADLRERAKRLGAVWRPRTANLGNDLAARQAPRHRRARSIGHLAKTSGAYARISTHPRPDVCLHP